MKTHNSDNTEQIPIEVSARILRHISRGIYRSPAGALKELISNSYDSGATKVTINTNYPHLDSIIITDNGKGITENQFKKIISQIGFSDKNSGDYISINDGNVKANRQIIGHYGIGFLAIGQLTKEATIITKTAGNLEGIKAVIDFDQFDVVNENDTKKIIIKDEVVLEGNDSTTQEKFPIGVCYLEKIKFRVDDKETGFTKIELTSIREDIKKIISGLQPSKMIPEVTNQIVYSANFEEVLALLST